MAAAAPMHIDPAALVDASLALEALPGKLPEFDKGEFEDTCKRRFFFDASFGAPMYSTAGLYDLGPIVCRMKANLMNLWRAHFVLEENMLEVETTAMTPEAVFDTSGHTERFTDVMVKDTVTGECIRIDKYIEEWTDRMLNTSAGAQYGEEQRRELARLQIMADGMSIPEFKEVIQKWDLKSPKGNTLGEPHDFMMMFPTKIGPEGDRVGFLRPELAQGIILNFRRLLEFNAGRMPFAGAAMGPAFRNEIAPRQNLIRVREFFLAEIEHFVDPDDKSHPKIDSVRGLQLWMWPKGRQESGEGPLKCTIGEALERGYVANETLAYFIARVKMFLNMAGVKYVRFRQHRSNEMAHYACDCWDAECLTGWSWIECVGIADRSAYDLTQHARRTKVDFQAYKKFPEPVVEECLVRNIDKQLVNRTFKRDAKATLEFLNSVEPERALALDAELEKGNVKVTVSEASAGGAAVTVELTRAMVKFEMGTRKVDGVNYIPHVIEPSFGIGRIIYSILEQSYYVRRDGAQGPAELKAPDAAQEVDPALQKAIVEQGDKVRQLKSAKAPKAEIDAAVAALKELKAKAGPAPEEKKKEEKKKEKKPGSPKAAGDDDKNQKRAVFTIPARIACYKVALLPLSPSVYREAWCTQLLAKWRVDLVRTQLNFKIDEGSQSIGKKYARMDEIGVPYCVTIDMTVPTTNEVTLRERDSMRQVWVPEPQIVQVLDELCTDRLTWDDCLRRFKEKQVTEE